MPKREKLTRAKAESLILRTWTIMGGWRSTPFQYEAAARHGLRSALCMEGWSWIRADVQAEKIVLSALRHMGAKRPTWLQGQREYTMPIENCNWCGVPLDEDDIAHHRRFCSVVCAKAAITKRDYETTYGNDAVGAAAFHLVALSDAKPRKCESCGGMFMSRDSKQRHCSWVCAGKARRLLEDRPCASCGVIFRPSSAGQRYCCHDCSVLGRVAKLEQRKCAYCGEPFWPKLETAMYCSEKCRQRVKDARQAAKRAEKRAPRQCLHCGKTFTPPRSHSLFCSERCSKAAYRKRQMPWRPDVSQPDASPAEAIEKW